MSQILVSLRQLTLETMILRLCIAMAFGGFIGIEREYKGSAAGFRTYMLVSLGAAATMLLGQYLWLMTTTVWKEQHITADVSRISAQVINGIGFLGTGSVLVSDRREVRGLTTAAGLWACACMGLAIGAGFYECVIPGCAIILISFRLMPFVERVFVAKGRYMTIYVELKAVTDLGILLRSLHGQGITVLDVDMEGLRKTDARPNFIITTRLMHRELHTAVLARLSKLEIICVLEEM